jgi:nucleotide-binding universal stress UspA family protein
VVGVDGSPHSERALDWAIAEAQRTGDTLQLVAAWLFPMALGYAFTSCSSSAHGVSEGSEGSCWVGEHVLQPPRDVLGVVIR